MKILSKVASTIVVLCAISTAPSVARAEDDNVYDGKSYPGAMCDSAVSTVTSARTGVFYGNASGSATTAVCPIIQDSWQSTGGLAYGKITISNPAGGNTFSCSQNSYDLYGGLQSSRSFSTTTSGISVQYFYSGTYLPTTAAEGYITITCTVPNTGQIRSYQVQERA